MALRYYNPTDEALNYLKSCEAEFLAAISPALAEISDKEKVSRIIKNFELIRANFEERDRPEYAREVRQWASKLADGMLAVAPDKKTMDVIIDTYESYVAAHESIFPFKEVELKNRIYKPDTPASPTR